MSTTAKASEHIKPCNIAQCERHNRRDPDYIKSLNPARLYIRTELSNRNETYVAPGMEGITLQQYYDKLKVLVKQKTGRAMQEKDVEYKDKKGVNRVRKGSSPIREGVALVKPDTTMDELKRYAQRVHDRWGITILRIDIHKDEGHYENPQDPSTWQENLHAHLLYDWIDHTTGKSFKLNAEDMSEMQDLLAETLDMQRGQKKADTGFDHLERNDYIIHKQQEQQRQLQQAAQKAIADKETADEELAQIREETEQAELAASSVNSRLESDKAELAAIEEEITRKKKAKEKLNHDNKDAIMDGVAKMFGKGKLAEKGREVAQLKAENDRLRQAIPKQHEQLQQSYAAAVKAEAEKHVTPYRQQAAKDAQTIEALKRTNRQLADDNAALKADYDKRGNLIKTLLQPFGKIMYTIHELFHMAIDAIIKYALDGGTAGHRDVLTANEAYVIDQTLNEFTDGNEVSRVEFGKFMADYAQIHGNLTDCEARRGQSEVISVAEHRYDHIIAKGMRGGLSI